MTIAKKKNRVLAIDDEPAMIEWLKILLEHEGYEVRTAMIGTRGEEIFKTWKPDVVVTDMMLPDADGLELLRKFKQTFVDTEVIVITGHGSVPKAVEAMKAGAHSFVEKPIEPDTLLAMLERAIERRDLVGENQLLKQKLEGQFRFGNIIGKSKKMHEVLELVESVAGSDANILIQGENGTGKELIANAIHYNSKRAKGPFIKINCAAIPKDLIESELFGYKKGAFTGAQTDKEGLFEMAEGGLAAARRDRRDAALPPDQAAARPAGARVPADRQRPDRARRLPADLRDQHRSRCGAARRQAARGSLLPDQHHHAAGVAAARADRGHPAALRALPREVPPASSAERQVDRAGRVSRADSAPLARQRPRAGERHRARRPGIEGHRDHGQRSARVAAHRVSHDRRSS